MKNPLDGVMQLVPQKAGSTQPGQKAPTGMFQYFLKVMQQQLLCVICICNQGQPANYHAVPCQPLGQCVLLLFTNGKW
jgi:hypothetical protein